MFENLGELRNKFIELEKKIADPEIINNQEQWQKYMKEHSHLQPIVEKYNEYTENQSTIKETIAMIDEEKDEELKMMAKEELSELEKREEELVQELKLLLVPKDPNDEKNVIVEIRAGAGGDEAALFAGELYRMYSMYAANRRWSVELMSTNEIGIGGYKEIVFMISGKGAYSKLKYESGVHRVQRVPDTESQGRIHTSTVTVAVLPEAEDVEIDLDLNDVRVDVFRSSGNGGQSVNTTDSAVRLTHIPTGIVISMQDEKSQLKNKDKAFKLLKAKLYDMEIEKAQKEMASKRKSQVGTGDRAERIRTYNFPQGRVTDHRISLTLYKLDAFMDGDIDEIVDALTTTEQTEKIAYLDLE